MAAGPLAVNPACGPSRPVASVHHGREREARRTACRRAARESSAAKSAGAGDQARGETQKLERRASLFEPCALTAFEARAELLKHLGMVAIDPVELGRREHLLDDQPAVDRREGQRLEAEH